MAATHARISSDLRKANVVLSRRGLNIAARWAAEMLCGLGPEEVVNGQPLETSDFDFDADYDVTEAESDHFMYAKSLFDCREYRRAVHVLDTVYKEIEAYPAKAFFLRCYALYLDGEKQKESERSESAATKHFVNKHVERLIVILEERRMMAEGVCEPFIEYLYGVVLREQGLKTEAAAAFIRSVNAYPYNWSAWLDLAALTEDETSVLSLELKSHWMKTMFQGHAYVEVQANASALQIYQPISACFPGASYVDAQVARAFYNLRQFVQAGELLEKVESQDPYRIEDVDITSNIYYVRGEKGLLGSLARAVMRIDKYRPEVCCVVGNYYSLRGEHEKAVCYFRRALRLNRNYLSAWTLMGHEYVELKNTAAAIECYRRAVDINPKDYRAWYGLGQTYELLQKHVYGAYYYKKAVMLRPYDPRMWCALGVICQTMRRMDEAIACFERAMQYSDAQGLALYKLGSIYESFGNAPEAEKYYKQYVALGQVADNASMAKALSYLANAAASREDWGTARDYAERILVTGNFAEVKAAKALLTHVESRLPRTGTMTMEPETDILREGDRSGVLSSGSPGRSTRRFSSLRDSAREPGIIVDLFAAAAVDAHRAFAAGDNTMRGDLTPGTEAHSSRSSDHGDVSRASDGMDLDQSGQSRS